ncbi:MAG: Stp1/IreP family PP2C-type Ser/Thr phosphatase [Clostridiaceae bacterium]|nr:Stp1/IreP family PP2C-type Ser/Thr phosphatase [Clostridiaceae bacterium]
MKYASKSDVGKRRSINEDYIAVSDSINLYIIADGMGGHNAGEVASKMAAEGIKRRIEEGFNQKSGTDEIFSLFDEAIKSTNYDIYSKASENDDCFGMGTTIDVCLVVGNDVYIAHIGDSRIYKISKEECRLVTKDHSVVWDLLTSGKITEVEAKNHPDRNKITRALGTEEDVKIDFIKETLDDCIYLMCTDGLSNLISDEEIFKIVTGNDIENAAEILVERANEKGGHDNITALLFTKS